MTPITRAQAHVLVRRMFLEELSTGQATDFIDIDDAPDEVDEAWDQAAQEQHLIALDDAEQFGRLEDHDNEYLRRYLMLKEFNLTRGTAEYNIIPSDVARIVKVEVQGLLAIRKHPTNDRLIRTWPSQYGPGPGEAFWIVLAKGLQSPPDPTDTQRTLRVYVYGDLVNRVPALPLNTVPATLTYYRLVYPVAYNSPAIVYTDSYEPWIDGIVHGATARLQEKAQQKPSAIYHYARAREFAHSIIRNPQEQAQARGQQGPNAS